MRFSSRLLAVVNAVLVLSSLVAAHSRARGPLKQASLVEYPTIHTPGRRAHAHSSFDLSFDLLQFPKRLKFALEPNQDILPPGASVQYLNEHGQVERVEEIDRSEHKIYKGTTWVEMKEDDWMQVGWARITLLRDGPDPVFEGVFTMNHDHHHVQLGSFYQSTKHPLDPHFEFDEQESMVVFRDSDIMRASPKVELKRDAQPDLACSYDKSTFNSNPNHHVFMPAKREEAWGAMSFGALLGKRQIDGGGSPTPGNSGGVNLKSTIGSTVGCPASRKVALIGVATDCSYTGSFNSTQSVRSNVISQINKASHVYETTFQITLGLQNLTVSDSTCPGTPPAATPWNMPCSTSNITDRLNVFSGWRGQHADNNAYWTLLTNCNTGSEVGLAWLGELCVNTAQTAEGETTTGANVVAKTSTEWQVIAHESGHTFGAVHDCDSQTCGDSSVVNSQQCCPLSNSTCDAGGQYIMNPSTSDGITAFSPCSIGNICSAIGRNSVKSSCLSDNKGLNLTSGHECGNGIVEDGEECDCGGPQGCGNNSCCDATTCKFKNNAVCDDSNEDCCKNCQFSAKGSVCRPSTGVCNPQEVCSGTNATCPPDTTAPDGQDCGNGLQCASGQCTSRDLQCKTLMGSYTSNNDTYACDSSDCFLSCASPDFGANTCYSMQQNFLDGTPCGGSGRCSNGQCQGDSVGGEITSWVNNNKPLVIGLSAGLGGLLLLSILGCIVRRCRRGRRPPKAAPVPQSSWQHQQQWQYQQFQQQHWQQQEQQRQSAAARASQQWPDVPPPPPMAHGWTRGASVRYA